jgi:hypothetical protein
MNNELTKLGINLNIVPRFQYQKIFLLTSNEFLMSLLLLLFQIFDKFVILFINKFMISKFTSQELPDYVIKLNDQFFFQFFMSCQLYKNSLQLRTLINFKTISLLKI